MSTALTLIRLVWTLIHWSQPSPTLKTNHDFPFTKEKEKVEKVAKQARQKADRDSKKAIQQPQNSKRKASQSSSKSNKR